jgi:hypothetical protein
MWAPRVTRQCQIDNPALPTLVPVVDTLPGWRIISITCPKMSLHTWHWHCLGEFQHAESFLCALNAILNITPLEIQNYCTRTWRLSGDSHQNFERFPFHPYRGHRFSVSSFCKINFWKCILIFLITLYNLFQREVVYLNYQGTWKHKLRNSKWSVL